MPCVPPNSLANARLVQALAAPPHSWHRLSGSAPVASDTQRAGWGRRACLFQLDRPSSGCYRAKCWCSAWWWGKETGRDVASALGSLLSAVVLEHVTVRGIRRQTSLHPGVKRQQVPLVLMFCLLYIPASSVLTQNPKGSNIFSLASNGWSDSCGCWREYLQM